MSAFKPKYSSPHRGVVPYTCFWPVISAFPVVPTQLLMGLCCVLKHRIARFLNLGRNKKGNLDAERDLISTSQWIGCRVFPVKLMGSSEI